MSLCDQYMYVVGQNEIQNEVPLSLDQEDKKKPGETENQRRFFHFDLQNIHVSL